MANQSTPALEVKDLKLSYRVRGRDREAIRGVTFTIDRGESYGLVGESGSGKSTVAYAVMRFLPDNARITDGSITLDGADLLRMDGEELRKLRAKSASMVYQNPGTALNPTIRVGDQLIEAFVTAGVAKGHAKERALAMLGRVQISDPQGVMGRYPHQLSGGMQQRVVIAMALASDPTLLILDEPTTGLDATVEAEVLDLIRNLRKTFGTSVLFISHNLGVIARMCDRVGVLYAGRMVEEGPAWELLTNPRHPYTVGLLRCIPRWGLSKELGALDTIPGFPPPIGARIPGCVFAGRCGLVQDICRTQEPGLDPVGEGHSSRCHFSDIAQTLPRAERDMVPRPPVPETGRAALTIKNLRRTMTQQGNSFQALAGVDLEIAAGEVFGLVGESGSGKTTLARSVVGLGVPDAGSEIQLEGKQLAPKVGQRSLDQVRAIQIVFQNPDASLNRRKSVRQILGRALTKLTGVHGEQRARRVVELSESVRLDAALLDALPRQLSGGLKQRVGIARAFAGQPHIVICDEPTSALDVSVQAAILNLLVRLQRDRDLSYIFISHDLGVVRYISDRIGVLYLGRLMEIGPADVVFSAPHHPYTEALLSAAPSLDVREEHRIRLQGDIPSAAKPPSGCVFHTRCPRKLGAICEQQEPPLLEEEPGHFLKCHIPIEDLRRLQKPEAATEAG
ncbi:MAG TPA: ABC transporter ATP-binding protein [Candidatus Nitrosopolaris sp.]|nr:ABC transporter ATP-binding protein [Candidatus Nitrosopolaris sp.]